VLEAEKEHGRKAMEGWGERVGAGVVGKRREGRGWSRVVRK